MKKLFHTVITSQRHRTAGFCEKSDFGVIDLFELEPSEKKLIVNFRPYSNEPIKEFIEHEGLAYVKMYSFPRMGREAESVWLKKQGKFSNNTAIKLMLELREDIERSYSSVAGYSFILIGKTLYISYCPVKELSITVSGNLLFSCWLSINIESHTGKAQFKLNEKTFEKVVKEEKARFEKAKPKKGFNRGDGHVHFSAPVNVVWGDKYKNNKILEVSGLLKA